MAQKRLTRVTTRRLGRRKSRARVGPRVFIFFVVMSLLIGAAAIELNLDIQDRQNAWDAKHHAVQPPSP